MASEIIISHLADEICKKTHRIKLAESTGGIGKAKNNRTNLF